MRPIKIAAAILVSVLSFAQLAQAMYPDFYSYDPQFSSGSFVADGFSGGTDSKAQKIVRLSNGDLLAVGLVPPTGNGLYHIGMARYSGSGAPSTAWSNYKLPAETFLNPYYTRIDDVALLHGTIYILADCECHYPSSTQRDAQILAVRESDGSGIAGVGAFDTDLDERGAGLVASSYTYAPLGGLPQTYYLLTAVATYTNGSSIDIVTAARYGINKNYGTLSVDNSFGPYNSGRNDYPAADNFCSANANCTVEAAATTALRTGTDSPTIYVAASTLWSGNDWNIAMLEIDGTGAGQWDMTYSFARGGDNDDRAVSIAASAGGSGDEVFLAAQVSTGSNSSGFALAKFTHANGIEGSLVIADGDVTTGRVYGYAIAMEGNLIGAVGSRSYTFGSGGYDPFLVVLTNNFTILDNHAQRLANPVCNPITHICFQTDGEYYGIIGSGDGGFYATGLSNDSSLDHTEFATAKFSNDRIFGDDFEGP